MYRKSYAIYCDREKHFFNDKLRDFLREKEIYIEYNSFDALKNTSIMKTFNRILKEILRKQPYFNFNLK